MVDGIEPDTYKCPFRKHTVKLSNDVRVDSFLLQYNPGHNDAVSWNQKFQGELHFDVSIVALIRQKACWILPMRSWLFLKPTFAISLSEESTKPMWSR